MKTNCEIMLQFYSTNGIINHIFTTFIHHTNHWLSENESQSWRQVLLPDTTQSKFTASANGFKFRSADLECILRTCTVNKAEIENIINCRISSSVLIFEPQSEKPDTRG